MKIDHVLKAKEFSRILHKGRKVSGQLLSLYIEQDARGSRIKVGIITPKKWIPTAVRRNYVRRCIYAHFRDPEEGIRPGTTVVARVKSDTRGTSRKPLAVTVKSELRELTEKAGVMK
ncbi:MAG: ribonuclease P protein component [Candidatus Tantalella remota]|nr:ribonuclease P protein component [Candidatus Tantalella remota]